MGTSFPGADKIQALSRTSVKPSLELARVISQFMPYALAQTWPKLPAPTFTQNLYHSPKSELTSGHSLGLSQKDSDDESTTGGAEDIWALLFRVPALFHVLGCLYVALVPLNELHVRNFAVGSNGAMGFWP